jgi:hypothetical protein
MDDLDDSSQCKSARTLGPWRQSRDGYHILAGDSQFVASTAMHDSTTLEESENAAYIVKACNSHDDLAQAVEALLQIVMQADGCAFDQHLDSIDQAAVIRARAILAKVQP